MEELELKMWVERLRRHIEETGPMPEEVNRQVRELLGEELIAEMHAKIEEVLGGDHAGVRSDRSSRVLRGGRR